MLTKLTKAEFCMLLPKRIQLNKRIKAREEFAADINGRIEHNGRLNITYQWGDYRS